MRRILTNIGGPARPHVPVARAGRRTGHCAGLAAAADQGHRAIPGRRRHRPDGPARRQAPERPARPAGLCREHRRRQRLDRRAGGDAGRAGRLHHRRPLRRTDDRQSGALSEQSVQHAARLHSGRDGEPLPVDADRASVHRHQDRGRSHQGRQGKARHAQLFLRRHRQLQPHGAGTAGASDRHQDRPCALSRHRPGHPGDPHRRGAASLQQRGDLARARTRRQEHRARHRRSQALARPAGRSDHRRDRARLRLLGLDRHLRSGQDAAGDRGEALQGRVGFPADRLGQEILQRPGHHRELQGLPTNSPPTSRPNSTSGTAS